MPSVQEKRKKFRSLHESGCFTIPNPWDVGSARLLQGFGFSALATTSSGFAWTQGLPDYAITRDSVIRHLGALCSAVDLPVNADFESGFAADLQPLAENIKLAIATGIAALSIEDRDMNANETLYSTETAVERVRTSKAAIKETREDVLLVARTEILLLDPGAVSTAIDKLVAFADAGADCLYAPGVGRTEDIAAMVKAVAPKPVNVLVIDPAWTANELADLGVRRISIGGALAQVGWKAVIEAATSIQQGSFATLTAGATGQTLNKTFKPFDHA
jgi:2-methylisocitrate lyase-like PEP mutase family enzyme